MSKRIKVESSAIFSVVYEDGTLFVEFVSSDWYKYIQVPKSVFELFLKDSSKGRFFNRFIKHVYRDEPLTNQELERVSLMPLEKETLYPIQ